MARAAGCDNGSPRDAGNGTRDACAPGGSVFADFFGDLEDGEDDFHDDAGGEDVKDEGDGAGDEGEEAVDEADAEATGHPADGGQGGGDEAEGIQDADEMRGDETLEGEVQNEVHDGADLCPDGGRGGGGTRGEFFRWGHAHGRGNGDGKGICAETVFGLQFSVFRVD